MTMIRTAFVEVTRRKCFVRFPAVSLIKMNAVKAILME
jgi:hypothetical protein